MPERMTRPEQSAGTDSIAAVVPQLASARFVSADTYRAELATVLRNEWQYVAPVEQLSRPGDRVPVTLGATPVVITRDGSGELRGLVNVCRHRLHPVVVEAGNSSILQCRYHGWTYGLQGELRSAPRCGIGTDLVAERDGLASVAVEEFGPWVFAALEQPRMSVRQLLTDCADDIDAMLSSANRRVFRERVEYRLAANWKLLVENSIECYHCPLIHATTLAKAFDLSREGYVNHIFEHSLIQRGGAKYLPRGMDQESARGFEFLFLPPNGFVAIDDVVMFVHTVVPTGPETCVMYVDIHVDPTLEEGAVAEWMDIYDQTLKEDKVAVERQQVGYRSGAVNSGRLLTESEAPLRWFENWLERRLSPALPEDPSA